MSIKVECISHDMRILDRSVGVRSTEQSVGIIVGGFCPQHHININSINILYFETKKLFILQSRK